MFDWGCILKPLVVNKSAVRDVRVDKAYWHNALWCVGVCSQWRCKLLGLRSVERDGHALWTWKVVKGGFCGVRRRDQEDNEKL
jgi:hypothetical protein